jgi:Type IV secretion system pilin
MIKNIKIAKNTKYFTSLVMLGVFCLSFLLTGTVSVVNAANTASPSNLNPVSTVLWTCTQHSANCGWKELVNLVNAMIQYGIQLIGMAFVIALLYSGFLYLTSGGDPSKVKKVREILNKIVWGLVYTLCGWVIVYFLLKYLGVDPGFYNEILTV